MCHVYDAVQSIILLSVWMRRCVRTVGVSGVQTTSPPAAGATTPRRIGKEKNKPVSLENTLIVWKLDRVGMQKTGGSELEIEREACWARCKCSLRGTMNTANILTPQHFVLLWFCAAASSSGSDIQ